MRHTQGKWEVTGQSENSRYITVKSDNGRTVARVPWNSEKEVEQGICTDNSDAILIAAAPVLLEELKRFLTAPVYREGRENIGWCYLEDMRRIITKAEGK